MTARGRIPELDGVRGCAIGLVLCWHFIFALIEAPPSTFWSYLQGMGRLTWSGVDLFFVLSGFLIGGILIDSRDSANYFRTFYTRRFFRIVPLYVAVLGIALIAAGGRIDQRIPALSYLAFLQNFWMARNATFGVLLGATWSLAVEEQFYLTLPSIIRFVNPRYLTYVVVTGIFAAPCLRLICFYRWPGNEVVSYVMMPCRADALLLGVLGALAMRDPQASQWIRNNGRKLLALLLIFVSGTALLTMYCMCWHTVSIPSAGYTWLAGLYLCGILYALTQPQSWLAYTMRLRWLRWLGSIAYGVYLVHQMAAAFIFQEIWHSTDLHLRSWGNIGAMAVAFGLTLAICQFSWMYFERPLLRFGHQYHYTDDRNEYSRITSAPRSESASFS